jgi:integrase
VTKRARGEGSIRKRPDGLWEARITLDSGKRRSFYGRTQTEVRNKKTDALAQQQRGMLTDPDRQTLAEYMAVWLEDSAKPMIRLTTYRLYEYAIRSHIAPATIGRLRLAKLTPQHIQRWLNDLSATDLSPKTVRLIFGTLKTALELAVKWNMLARNPATLVDPPRLPYHEIKSLTPAQVTTLLKAAEGHRLYPIYALAVALGMRQGEILALRWQDVDLDGATLTVAHTLQQLNRNAAILLEPKTKAGIRRITMPAMIVTILRQHRVRQLEERLQAKDWEDNGYIFTSPAGKPLYKQTVFRHFKPLLAAAGLPDMRFHDLRHTAASLMLAQSVPPRMIMEILGHSNIGITMDTYAHILPSLRQEAAEAMERILKG